MSAQSYALNELNKETTIGGLGEESDRQILQIDLADFDNRKAEIAEALWEASTTVGFFQLVNHGIPQAQIDEAFELEEMFFALSAEEKSAFPLRPGTNAGWEYKAQVRPSTGTADQKESYQITLPRMSDLWPSEEQVPGFKDKMMAFERANWELGMKVLSCFAMKLGFEESFFTTLHDPASPEYQSTLRLLHYLALVNPKPEDYTYWRAGAHTDYDCLTLLHQRPGQGGLQVCPGQEYESQAWTSIPPLPGVVTCNIGDMLMRWSDDKLKSTLHRVRMPRPEESHGPRYSMAFFCQANKDAMIQGPEKKYEPMTAHDYLQMRIAANFGGTKAVR